MVEGRDSPSYAGDQEKVDDINDNGAGWKVGMVSE